jgi:aminopeptidase N
MRRLRRILPAVLLLAGAACAGRGGAVAGSMDMNVIGPGVSLELAQHRAASLSDVAYAVELDVTPVDVAYGSVVIDLTRRAGAGDLILDFRGTALDSVYANGSAIHADWDGHHVRIAQSHLRTGPNRLRFRFAAPVAAAGAAIIRYDDTADDARYLYTLLVPSDAQLLFPVLDQPDIKARFTWTIITPADWVALANGAPAGTRAVDATRVARPFAATLPISPHTASFAAGPWVVIEHPVAAADDVVYRSDVARDMKLYVRRSRAAEIDADTLLDMNRAALAWLERYFDMPYPFEKLDLLLAPAFPFGGMEHVGAIFYNETTFIFREPPTPTRRLARAATSYHEVAHQWFGDLVTMRWFDDLWLKEGFSTFMAARIQHELHPDGDAWKTFYLRNKPLAYGVDVTAGTTPVWQELPNLDLAKSNYGPIVYNKAPAVLRQLEFLVGDDAFRRGMQLFLRRHAYANAGWQELLAAISEAAGADLTAFGEQYILRPGAPLIETRLDAGADGRIAGLTLHQRPARVLPGDPGGWWPGRVRVRLGYATRDDVVLDVTFDGEYTRVSAAAGLPLPDYIAANDGDYGYGIFLPDARSTAWLLDHAATLTDDLARAMAWGALWDLVREARLAPAHFADAALPALHRESDEQIAGLLLGRVATALERYIAAGPTRDRLAEALEAALLERVADESLDYGLRRGSLDALLGSARSVPAVAALKEYLAGRRLFAGEPLGQPSRWAAVTRLLAIAAADADSLYRAEQARDATAEAQRMAFIAGAAVPDSASKAAYWTRFFADAALNEEWVTAALGSFNHQRHAHLSLPYLLPALERAEWLRDNRRIFFLPRWLDAFIGGHSSADALAIVDAFLDANPTLPVDVRRRVLQSRDELERAVRIRQAFSGG